VVPLVDLQRQVRDAVVNRDSASIASFLVGGIQPTRRFDIHLRHYEESLTAAVVGRFPATGWLIGPTRLETAARAFVHACPPTAVCIAEYGAAFPDFLATWPETARLTYVPAFADLDWHLGRLAASVDLGPVSADQLRQVNVDILVESVVGIQPGTHYLDADWAIDTLMKMYLADTSPGSWTLGSDHVHLEVRGARGEFHFARLSAAEHAFRARLAAGRTLGDAAAMALTLDDAFDPGAALLALVGEHLVTSIGRPDAGHRT
jgi:hypothetical protein